MNVPEKTPDEQVTISREIQCDVGHRIPFHGGPCYNVHGHRYRIIATVQGPVNRRIGFEDDGMVTDFGWLKKIMMDEIHQEIDHAFMVWKNDEPLRSFLQSEGYRLVVMECVPTAENLAAWCSHRIIKAINALGWVEISLVSVKIWETPNCSATYKPSRGTEKVLVET